MIKLIVLGALGLLVGIGGGSALSVMKAKKAFATFEAAKAKAVADSVAGAQEHGKGANAAAEAGPHEGEGAPDSTLAHNEPSPGPGTVPAAGDHAPRGDAPAHEEKPAAGGAHRANDGRSGESSHEPAPVKPATSTGKAVATVESRGATLRPRLAALPPKPIETVIGTGQNEKVSRIFAVMPAKDAAKVLEQLDDNEVQSILTGLPDKQAAGILQNLPPARAAAISKLVLRGGRQ